MGSERDSHRSFFATVLMVFTLVAAANYLPILQGRIPFPNDLALQHPAFDGVRQQAPARVASLIDLVTQFYPFRTLMARASEHGTIPLWNPYILAGAPFEANSQSSLFYPPNFLYYVLPTPAAWTTALLLRMLLAGVFMAMWVRAVGGSQCGSIVSGIIFACCGFITAWQGYAIGDAAIWLPMICYALKNLSRSQTVGSACLLAICFAMPVLAGHPETAAHLTLTGVFLALLLWPVKRPAETRVSAGRFAWLFVLAGLLAIGLAAIQMIPTLQWLGQMGPRFNEPWPALAFHDGQSFFSRDILTDPNSALLPVPEAAAYLGMLGFLAAPFGLLYASRRHRLFLVTIIIVAVGAAFSIQPVHWVFDHLPVIKALKNGRLILVAGFGIATLSGLGISALQRRKLHARLGFGLLLAGLLVGGIGIFEVHRATFDSAPPFMRGPSASLLFLMTAGLLFAVQLRRPLPDRLFTFAVCAITAVEMLTFSYGYLRFARVDDVFPRVPVFDFLNRQGDPSSFRIAKTGYPIPANSGLMYGLQMAEGYDISTERTQRFAAGLAEMRADGVFFLSEGVTESRDRRIDLLNVRYFLVRASGIDFARFSKFPERFSLVYREGEVVIFENKKVLPRAFVVPQSGVEVIADPNEQLKRIQEPSFDPAREIVLPAAPPVFREQSGDSVFRGEVRLSGSNVNRYTFQTATSQPSILLLSQIFYPGWSATIDGVGTAVQPADYGLTAIAIPSGTHEIRFAFTPASFKIGAVISIVSAGIAIALIVAGLFKCNVDFPEPLAVADGKPVNHQ